MGKAHTLLLYLLVLWLTLIYTQLTQVRFCDLPFCGSTELIKRIRTLQSAGRYILFFKSFMDPQTHSRSTYTTV